MARSDYRSATNEPFYPKEISNEEKDKIVNFLYENMNSGEMSCHMEYSQIPNLNISKKQFEAVINELKTAYRISQNGYSPNYTLTSQFIDFYNEGGYSKNNKNMNKNVFVVHGHSKMMLLEVTNYIASELHLNPIVLSLLPNNGMTIIEKFEHFSSDVQFAIILLSPDDVGGIDENHLKGRARQNVIFEFGYFVAKLGRNKVCALLNQDVEKPSDIDGVLYLPYDNHWKFNLLKEIKNAGVPV